MNRPKLILKSNDLTLIRGEQIILKQIDFELVEAEFCYLIGKTGSGKSTFLKSLFGAVKVVSGHLEVCGFDLTKIQKEQLYLLRRKIGMVFQDFKLFEDWTVAQNLIYVLAATDWKNKVEIKDRVDEVLEAVDLSSKSKLKVNVLSGGEKQRLAVARAILNYPSLLIADEPTGNLDPEAANNVLYLIKELTQKYRMATILATHDFRLMEKFPARVFNLKEGRIIEQV